MSGEQDLIDRLAQRIADAIGEAIQTAVQRELARTSLIGADADRAAFVDALAQSHSGHPNPNRIQVRDRANDLTIKLSRLKGGGG